MDDMDTGHPYSKTSEEEQHFSSPLNPRLRFSMWVGFHREDQAAVGRRLVAELSGAPAAAASGAVGPEAGGPWVGAGHGGGGSFVPVLLKNILLGRIWLDLLRWLSRLGLLGVVVVLMLYRVVDHPVSTELRSNLFEGEMLNP